MGEHNFKHKLPHWLLRLLIVITVVDTLLDEHYSPYYYDWYRRHGLAGIVSAWTFYSVIIMPALVGLEWFWLWRNEVERRSLAIDTLVVIGYVMFWCGMLLYAWTHYAII
jgi:hypothetical protein